MLRFSVFPNAIACLVWLVLPSVAQDVISPQLNAIDSKVLEDEGVGAVERRRRFLEREGHLRRHYRPTPAGLSSEPFSKKINSESRPVVGQRQEARFGRSAHFVTLQEVTRQACLVHNHASQTSEPSVAARGDEILVTGNWYALFSRDSGRTFQAVDPWARFKVNARHGLSDEFCCDQLTFYDRTTDTMYWLQQGKADARGNVVRLKYATGAEDIRNLNFRNWDFISREFSQSEAYEFDYPSLAVSDRHLFFSLNVFDRPGTEESKWVGAIVFRLQKDQLAQYQRQVNARKFIDRERGSLRLVQGAGNTMFIGSHPPSGAGDRATIQVRAWHDNQPSPTETVEVRIENWKQVSASPHATLTARDNVPWLHGVDDRITAGWLAKGVLGFAWSAGADNRFRMPHTRVALVREDDIRGSRTGLSVNALAEPHLWRDSLAMVRPAAAPNSLGQVAVGFAYGGPNNSPGYAVGFLTLSDTSRARIPARWEWNTHNVVAEGLYSQDCRRENGELRCKRWGDYFAITQHGQDPTTWTTMGYVLKNRPRTEAVRAEGIYAWFGMAGNRITAQGPGAIKLPECAQDERPATVSARP